MAFNFNMGKGVVSLDINDQKVHTLRPNVIDPRPSEDALISEAMAKPITSKRLKDLVKTSDSVVIVTSDISRPMPSDKVLPYVIDELSRAGIEDGQIKVILALGSHRIHSESEKIKLVGESIYKRIDILDSDRFDCINHGICKHGTPVDVDRRVSQSDVVICLGNIEYHYFAGYSGGAKAIMPGVSSLEAIEANHKNMLDENAKAGILVGNPVREDIDEVGEKFKIDFLVNVVLDEHKKIVGAFAGHWKEAHRVGCQMLDDLYGVEIDRKYDLVILSPGGHPKDLNLYQSQKALDNGKHALKEKGVIIMVSESKDGFGSETFRKWLVEKEPEEMLACLKKKFVLGGHKAASIGKILLDHKIIWVSKLNKSTVESTGMVYAGSLDEAYKLSKSHLEERIEILLMPYAGSTMPIEKRGGAL